jgi:hypothetical protein
MSWRKRILAAVRGIPSTAAITRGLISRPSFGAANLTGTEVPLPKCTRNSTPP